MKIINTIHAIGLLESQASTLLLVNIDIEHDKFSTFVAGSRNKSYLYRFITENLLFIGSITNNTQTIFITWNQLKNAKSNNYSR